MGTIWEQLARTLEGRGVLTARNNDLLARKPKPFSEFYQEAQAKLGELLNIPADGKDTLPGNSLYHAELKADLFNFAASRYVTKMLEESPNELKEIEVQARINFSCQVADYQRLMKDNTAISQAKSETIVAALETYMNRVLDNAKANGHIQEWNGSDITAPPSR